MRERVHPSVLSEMHLLAPRACILGALIGPAAAIYRALKLLKLLIELCQN